MEKVREHPEVRGVNLREMKNDDRVRPVPSNALSAWAVSIMKCCAATGARVARRASGRGGGHAARAGGGVRRARVQAAALLAVDPANMLAMDPSTRRRSAQGPASNRLRYTTVFHPAGRQNVGLSQPLARGGVVPPAGRRVWGPTPPAKPTCPQQRRRHPGSPSASACRCIACMRMGRAVASRG